MSAELSHLEILSIFRDESAIYVFVYAVYALLVCAVLFFVDVKAAREAGGPLSRLLLYNALLALLAIAAFTLSMLLFGWYSWRLGGEIAAFAITLVLTVLAMYFFRSFSIAQLALGYRSTLLPGLVPVVVLAAPYALGVTFIFLLAAGMQN